MAISITLRRESDKLLAPLKARPGKVPKNWGVAARLGGGGKVGANTNTNTNKKLQYYTNTNIHTDKSPARKVPKNW